MTAPTEPDDGDDDAPAAPKTLPAQVIPDFAPVPRQADRSNGWKPEVQRAFIEALAETGSVRSACRRVGRADHGAYLLRRHPEAEQFRRAWAVYPERLPWQAVEGRSTSGCAALRTSRHPICAANREIYLVGGTARSTATSSRSIPTASSSAPAPSTTTAC